MFITALFTIAKRMNYPKCPLTDEWGKQNGVHIYNGFLLCHKKEWRPGILVHICNSSTCEAEAGGLPRLRPA
jgi:hypothetical protein